MTNINGHHAEKHHFLLKWSGKKLFLVLAMTWLLVALLELTQDMISVALEGRILNVPDSLIFKSFWLLFIPFNFILIKYLIKRYLIHYKSNYYIYFILSILLSAAHLLVFAILLSVYSGIVHTNPWSVAEMIYLKLTTRLYIVLAVNSLLGIAVLWSLRSSEKPYKEVIPVKTGKKSQLVRTRDIHWIGTDQGYVSLHTNDRKYVLSGSLKALTTELDPSVFKRVHKSTIVNMDQVRQLKSRLNGDYDILMLDGTELRLSRNYAKALKGTWL